MQTDESDHFWIDKTVATDKTFTLATGKMLAHLLKNLNENRVVVGVATVVEDKLMMQWHFLQDWDDGALV